jgi:hypothetical protein
LPDVAFEVRNRGRGAARDVEIGITASAGGTILAIPDLGVFVTHTSVGVRNFRVLIPRLLPGEEIALIVRADTVTQRTARQMLRRMGVTRDIPWVTYLRSDRGQGENLTRSHSLATKEAKGGPR